MHHQGRTAPAGGFSNEPDLCDGVAFKQKSRGAALIAPHRAAVCHR